MQIQPVRSSLEKMVAECLNEAHPGNISTFIYSSFIFFFYLFISFAPSPTYLCRASFEPHPAPNLCGDPDGWKELSLKP